MSDQLSDIDFYTHVANVGRILNMSPGDYLALSRDDKIRYLNSVDIVTGDPRNPFRFGDYIDEPPLRIFEGVTDAVEPTSTVPAGYVVWWLAGILCTLFFIAGTIVGIR